MTNIFCFFVLAAYLQFVFCLPTTQTQSGLKDSSSTEQNGLIPAKSTLKPTALTLEEQNAITRERKRLSAMIAEGEKKHHQFLLKGSNKITKEILADPAINNINSVDRKKEKAVLEQFVRDSDDIIDDTDRKCVIRVLKDFYTFTNEHFFSKNNLTNVDDIWFKVLKAHGMDQFDADEAELLNQIGYQYADEFDKYLKSLSPAGLEKEKDLVYVQETYLENKDIMDKASYGFRYVNFFNKQKTDV
ncbi:PREDICTED: uncharacterized protein LOC108967913 [Bactrocera latifrons]|uniref:uncharacterized protein LOC108967913 n=1 Tax=Bactrocera latifrons TaxID=174628 RepID=UPI0008DC96E3|nr:PREDICTED: uncharacterized protein LOC108967913 [Bactrocera latifrons]